MAAYNISVRDTLKLLDGPFEPVAAGVSNGIYAFWLGSGISFGRAPRLRDLVGKVVEYVRRHIALTTRTASSLARCKRSSSWRACHRRSVRDRTSMGPFANWPDQDAIAGRLVSNYAKLLGMTIDGEEMDYLLWTVIDVSATFADPSMTPDVEHLCLATLSLEGATPEMLSANWDPLIERAVAT